MKLHAWRGEGRVNIYYGESTEEARDIVCIEIEKRERYVVNYKG